MINLIVNLAKIRYNTESNGEDLCWRLILDGEEMLVESIQINAPVFTSRDWVESAGQFKHHISVSRCRVQIDDHKIAVINDYTA